MIHIFGIRHHGPGSARSLRAALERLRPDIILVEGPPDADALIPLAAHPAMQPPVALLLYVPDQPRRAVYYPFARFSPEWQALRFGLAAGIPVRFMDLPQAHQLAAAGQEFTIGEAPPEPATDRGEELQSPDPQLATPRADPLGWLAAAAGYSDGERWWEHMIEHRRDGSDLFAAINEAMAALLKGMPKIAVQATWVPWTHGRLAFQSGYGAGIESPGWYEHIWQSGEAGHATGELVARWLTRVARLLREQDLDISSAHVIEGVRLAEALAALRERPLPGLAELNEAVQAVFCFGSALPMRLIHEKLIVGETLGEVPAETPLAPLQQDLAREQRRLRMPAEASWRDYDLDLRKPNELGRSHLLHRLGLLAIPWGDLLQGSGDKGTFHERWRVQWQPELTIALIEAGVWGTTIADAASACTRATAERTSELPALTTLVDQALLADLPDLIGYLMQRLQEQAALSSDIAHLMGALPPLASVLRYGNVRNTDTSAVAHVLDGLVVRICVGLPAACSALDDDAAEAMFVHIQAVNTALGLLQHDAHTAAWHAALARLAGASIHGLVAGRAVRILLDSGQLSADAAARAFSQALSPAASSPAAAAWVEGLLRHSGALLVHDRALWQIIDAWLAALPDPLFVQTLPLLRRTFATFQQPERRMLGERARAGQSQPALAGSLVPLDHTRGAAALPVVLQLLGLDRAEHTAP